MLFMYGVLMNVSFYSAFLTGLYQWRSFEFSMKRIPVVFRLSISTIIAASACNFLYNKQIYNPELYRISLKYRPEYDPRGLDHEKEYNNYM